MAQTVFVACTEPGPLEQQSILLFESIRRWTGRFRQAPILSFKPRRSIALDKSTDAAFSRLEVESRPEILNTEFEHEPFANKIFAGVWVEEHRSEEIVIFVDSDSVFTAEPTAAELGPASVAAVRPGSEVGAKLAEAISTRFIGHSPILGDIVPTSHQIDRQQNYWDSLHTLCGTRVGPTALTAIDRLPVRGYWNAGLVIVRREAGIFHRWLENYRTLVRAQHLPRPINQRRVSPRWLSPQYALSPALAAFPGKVRVLDGRYNYTLGDRDRLEEPFRSAPLEQLVHVHYFNVFRDPRYLDRVNPPFPANSEVLGWLRGQRLDRLEPRDSQELARVKQKLKIAKMRNRKQRQKRQHERMRRRATARALKDALADLAKLENSRRRRLG